MVVVVVSRLAEHSAEEGAVGESEAGGVSDLGRVSQDEVSLGQSLT